jgi:putative nucleotidyltransferase with HDIG domain
MEIDEKSYIDNPEWSHIDPIQRDALNDTTHLFESISAGILKSEPISYAQVKTSCTTLVKAVSDHHFYEILSSVRGHDDYSYVHSLRVATLLSHFGHELGLRDDDLLTLATGGLLHDIGKVAIPLHILNKPGPLDAREWGVMRSHVTQGLDMIHCVENVSRGVRTIAAQHHERLDGSGYPHGLPGRALGDPVRLATIVDVFCALTDRRVYKAPLPPGTALSVMRGMTRHLDQNKVRVFQDIMLSTAALTRAVGDAGPTPADADADAHAPHG